MTGTIFDIKEMALHDGPGIRTTVFFKGCPLRCLWCHNPEGLNHRAELSFNKSICTDCKQCYTKCSHPECQPFGRCLKVCPVNALGIYGEVMDASSLSKRLIKSASVLGSSFGGFTFSGGEPLMQKDFLLSLIDELSEYHIAIETSAYAPSDVFEEVAKRVDLVIMDIKLFDEDAHKKYTGVSNKQIKKNFLWMKSQNINHIIRTPLIPTITDTWENLDLISEFIGDSKWEKLPYNYLAGAKYPALGLEYPLENQIT